MKRQKIQRMHNLNTYLQFEEADDGCISCLCGEHCQN